jgi:hypothetical protein
MDNRNYKFNVIIAKRGRDKYLRRCLESLNEVAYGYNVNIFIGTDDSYAQLKDCYRHLSINFIRVCHTGYFNKSKLLNEALRVMDKDFDFVSIVDVDMIYNPDFFSKIIETVISNEIYMISVGYKLTKDSTKLLIHHSIPWNTMMPQDCIDKEEKAKGKFIYPSQVTMSKDLYTKLTYILGTGKLYDETFKGWGGEDSYLSFFSTECHNQGIIQKKYVENMWYHLWHPPTYNKEQHEKNLQYLEHVKLLNKKKIVDWKEQGSQYL